MKRFNIIIGIYLLLILFPSFLFSQMLNQRGRTQTQEQQKVSQYSQKSMEEYMAKEKRTVGEPEFPMLSAQALEKIIDPAEYIVGPGDLFYVNILGERELVFPAQVTPEGKLILQTVGVLFVDGKTLAEVKKEIIKAGEKKYKHNQVNASLVQLRTLRVHVVGEVQVPGTYEAFAVDRVSLLIEKAQSLTDWADERHIEIRHRNGKIDTLDLFKYKKFGELEQNIYVQNGDVIFVPPIKLTQKTVSLEGYVEQPGVHQIVAGEKLSNFLLRVNAFQRTLDPQKIYLIRKDSNGREKTIHLNLLAKESNQSESIPHDIVLQDGDQIFVPSVKNQVYVQGAVHVPGGYSYMAGFKARDYVGLAGGDSEMGNIKGIIVIHHRDNSIEKGPDVLVDRGDTVVVPLNYRKKITEYLQIVTSLATLVFVYLASQK